MRRNLWGIPFGILLLAASGVAAESTSSAAAAVEAVVTSAYVEGIHKEGNPEKIRAGFHPEFVMFVKTEEGVRTVTRDAWIARIEEGQRENPDRPRPEIGHEYSLVEVTGDAAVARVEIHRDGEHVFTDYLSLYRFDDGWKIVGKIFERH